MKHTADPFNISGNEPQSISIQPQYVMLKPTGSICNLACQYCYYTEKKRLYPKVVNQIMDEDLLERFTKQYIDMQPTPNVLFTWHGGETLMRPIKFYEHALELQRKYGHGRNIDNCIQTNATLITDEWARFFRNNNFLVGVSIDGPQEFHDEYRRSRSGKPTWQQVIRGIQLLNKYNVEWNALAVVNDFNGDYPLDFYHFFKEIHCHYIQFTPIVERKLQHSDGRELSSPTEESSEVWDFSITPEQWGDFLCKIFDEWIRHDVGEYYIQLFDATLANWMGVPPGICTLAETCGHATAMEFNGDVYACDHFVFPEYKIGNINERPLFEITNSPEQKAFGADKKDSLPQECKECEWLFACHGECPRLRFMKDKYGNSGLNYLCSGYRKFFEHAAPYMDYMKYQLQQDEAPAKVMKWIAEGMPQYRLK